MADIYRYVFDAPQPVGLLYSVPTSQLDVAYAMSLEIGRYLTRVEQYVGGYTTYGGELAGGHWVAV